MALRRFSAKASRMAERGPDRGSTIRGAVLRSVETCGRDARAPKPRLRRGCAFPGISRRRRGLLGCAGVPARTFAAGATPAVKRSRPPPAPRRPQHRDMRARRPRAPPPAASRHAGETPARPLLPPARSVETCGQDARGPGPRLRRGCAFLPEVAPKAQAKKMGIIYLTSRVISSPYRTGPSEGRVLGRPEARRG